MTTPFKTALLAAALALPATTAARAEIVEASADHFALALAFDTDASPDAAFSALSDVSVWWAPEHTYSGAAINMSLDLSPGGCLCEAWADGLTKHAEVIQVRFGRMVRLLGAFGPLQQMGVSQIQDLTVEPTDAGAHVSWTTTVKGIPSDHLDMLAPAVDAVLGEQIDRLERYLATGSPDAE